MRILKNFITISVFLSLILTFNINYLSNYDFYNIENVYATSESSYKLYSNDNLIQPTTNWGIFKEKVEVKGIYVSGNSLAYKPSFDRLLKLLNETELNAMVIDVKDDRGILSYVSNVDIAKEIGANKSVKVKNFDEVMDVLRENNIYTIARIVTFKDRVAGLGRPDLTIKTNSGSVWKDNRGNAWLNPYNKESWEYPIKLAEEAALKGFKEIQFDYVRFPTDGNRSIINYGKLAKEKPREEAIADFLCYARKRLEPLGVYVSADIFGLATTSKGDVGIGHHLETLATSTDILCAMVYPSHYALGSYGIQYPDTNPYEIVYKSLSIAEERLKNLQTDKKKAIQRPWLQDFSATWLKNVYKDKYITYGPDEIRAQIDAAYDAGIKEWIFWNAANKYTKEGFLKEEVQ